MASLLIGCGNSRAKKIQYQGKAEWTGELTTIDMDPNCGADVVMDLSRQFVSSGGVSSPGGCEFHMPFDDETFDELAAYDSLEHWGQQGDWRGWFAEMGEYHRIMKPGATFGIVVPIGADALADPGHTRFFGTNHFYMLDQQWYADRLAEGQQITDYRWYWDKCFKVRHLQNIGGHHLSVVLQKA